MSLDSYAQRSKDMESLLERAKKIADPSEDLQLLITELEDFVEGQQFTSYVWPMNNLEVRWSTHFFYRQLDFSSEPGVANEILENEAKSCLTVA